MVLALPRMEYLVARRRSADKSDIGPLARILRRLRAERGWYQKDVVARTGFDQPYYSTLETGTVRRPSDQRLATLDEAFGLAPGTFKGWLDAEEIPHMSHQRYPRVSDVLPGPRGEIIALLENVPDELAHYILGMIHGYMERQEPEN